MQAILQGRHNRFCAWLKENRIDPAVNTEEINALENELLVVYDRYRMRMDDLKEVIDLYERIEKTIRTRLKENRRLLKEGKDVVNRDLRLSPNLKFNL